MSPARAGIGHRLVQRFELVVQGAHAPAAGDGLVEHAPAGHFLDVLAEVADRHPLRHRHVALVGGFLAGDHPEERGLPRPVRTDEPDLLSRVELKGRVDEEHLAAVLLADSGERNHPPHGTRSGCAMRSRGAGRSDVWARCRAPQLVCVRAD